MTATTVEDNVLLTYEDYCCLPDDGKRYEILEGALVMTPAPATRHQKISRKIQFKLMEVLENHDRGEVYDAPCDVILSQHTVVQPDLVYVSKENAHIIGKQSIQGAPDLVIEILSPSTRRRDVLTKSKIYARHGIPSYWVVDPEMDRIETYSLNNGSYQLVGTHIAPDVMKCSTLPSVELPLDYVFAN